MIRKTTLGLLLLSMTATAMADRWPLDGFAYGETKAPSGKEWESVEELSLNKEQPRAWFFSFDNVESARKVLPENSAYWQSLDGTWKFHFATNPDERPKNFFETTFDVSNWDNIPVPSNWNIVGLQKNGEQKYGVPIYVNQPVIFKHSVKVDDWRGGVMRTPPTHYTTFKYRNEVGSYRRTFEVPTNWDGREVFINFDGVDSFFYIWINGQYVGFSKNSRNAAAFNITKYLQKGTNQVAVEVYRSSDGSFLEAQDMFRLPGIFRTVAIYSTPKVQVNDLVVKPDLDATYTNGELQINARLRNLSTKEAKGYTMHYSLFENELFSEKNKPTQVVAQSEAVTIQKNGGATEVTTILKMTNPNKWNGETPYLYTLVGELKDKKGKVVETVSTLVGFREVEIKDTPASEDEFGLAGRYYYVNGKPVKLKGVNRHETHPEVGHAVTRKMMEDEILLMLRGNINHVRNSHYVNDPYWYFLCNKYGIYLEDEANIESHQYYYGDASLSHPVEWRKAHVARVMEMAHANINHPSIVIWSLGNEAGPGKNFVAAYDSLKKFDATRPVQYERNNSIVDMGSNQYPSIGWVRSAVKGNAGIKYPFHISEYAHSMGNAVGNLIDYWEAMESTNFFCGGAIWDWIDQSIYNYTADGTRYLAYGGDFGDTPNDGQFVMNGIIFADHEPKPQYYEVKKVYQYVGIKAVDAKRGDIEIFNKNYYTDDLTRYDVRWLLYADGVEVKSGAINLGRVAPRSAKKVNVAYGVTLDPAKEYFLKVQFLQKSDMPWAKRGFVQAEEQLLVQEAAVRPSIAAATAGGNKIDYTATAEVVTVKGTGFEAKFDVKTGTVYSLKYGNESVIAEGEGPKLDAFRAYTSNDNWFYQQWFENGLHNLQHKTTESSVYRKADGAVALSFTVVSQAPNGARSVGGNSNKQSITEHVDRPFTADDFKFTTNQIWTVYPDGSIELQAGIVSSNPNLVLPRLGYVMKVPQKYSNFSYYGRGPIDNYPDRKTGQFIEIHKSKVADEFSNFPKPQDMGNHQETRWCALTNQGGAGVLFVGTQPLAVSALQYSALDMTLANHPYELPKAGDTYLHLDMAITGLGGNSCGQGGPLEHDCVRAGAKSMGFIIRPATSNLAQQANVSASGDAPLMVMRNNVGEVSIESSKEGTEILYTLNNAKKAQAYEKSFSLRDGGTVVAWDKSNPALKYTVAYGKIESVPTRVAFASSQERGEGNASNLTDNKTNTYWHTMYSVTVAGYPHWIDFDCGEEKLINGFSFLPRQDSRNGLIKGYSIQLSNDGENWAEPIQKGEFENNQKEKRVMFAAPTKARYMRFTALSSQDGQDFATGAEFKVLAQ